MRSNKVARFNRAIFSFYRAQGRKMPWRETRDPYRILVSEIMLQQTQVDRVRAKYAEFLRTFPTLRALASAPLGRVLRAWSGLGYNRRAKHLHECAKAIVASGGSFPRTFEGLVALPGIGRSTAAGVMAFAWNAPTPMVDTNLRRVLSRAFFRRRVPSDAELYAFATKMIPRGRGREWNYAMLDVAAIACTARRHAADCPLAPLHGRIDRAEPVRTTKAPFVRTDRYARGRIVEELRAARRGRSLPALARVAQRDEKKTRSLLSGLMRDGLVVRSKGNFMLPE